MEQKRSRTRYIVAAVIVVALIVVLWVRYAGTQKLIRDLDSKNPRVQEHAARILLERRVLEDSLPAQPEERRAHAAAALALVARQETSEQLVKAAMTQLVALIKDPEDLPQRAASRAMGRLGAKSITYLLPVLQEGDDRAKEAAVMAFAVIGEPAVPDLTKALGNKDRRQQAAIALGKIRGTAIAPLLKAAWCRDKDLRGIAIKVLGEVKERRALEAAIDALRLKELRRTAIIALGLIGDARAAANVIPYLKDRDLRIDAATALGAMEDVRAVAPLLAELRDPETQFHNRAVWALQRIGRPAVPMLTAALKSDSVYVRRAAAEGLRFTSAPESVPALVAALHDPDVKVRAAAASALGWEDNAAAVPPLLAAFDDPDWRVADAAVRALAAVGQPAVEPLISMFGNPQPVKERFASDALAQMSRAPVARLLQATRSESAAVREWAAVTLGKIGDTSAVARLREMAATAQGDERWAAQQALRRLGVPTATS
jgi:HEAT repeat protein